MKHTKLHLLILIVLLPLLHGCQKYPENPNRPILPAPITIYPSTMYYYDPTTMQSHYLNLVSDWIYITSDMESTSRGIIVYHLSDTEFLAYDRMPPNEPNACTDSQGNTTRLGVDFPFVVDRCNNAYYSILDWQLNIREPDMIPDFPTDGTMVYPLIQYRTTFDGNKLVISN